MQLVSKFLNKSLGIYTVRGLEVEPTYWQAITIVILLFLLVFVLARMRYLYIHWNLGKSAIAFLFWGFLLALIVEAFLVISGKTLFTTVLGWNSAPKPISTLIDISRKELVPVLGSTDEISSKEVVISKYNELSESDANEVKDLLCKP